MFLLQTAFLFVGDHYFKEDVRQRRELVLQDSAAGKIPSQQAASVASALQETGYAVSSHVRNVLWVSLAFNFSMLLIVASDRRKNDD